MSESTKLTKGVYKNKFSLNDTILTLFCAKFPDRLHRLGFHNTPSASALADLSNRIIGTSEYSVQRQIGNIEYLMGKNETQYCVSEAQRTIFEKCIHMSEDELTKVCTRIIDNTSPSVYTKFLEIQAMNMGIDKAKAEKKTRETFKAESDAKRDAELRRLGFDPSKMKSKGVRTS